MERIPPHNPEAEKSVLGACMLSQDALSEVMETVKPEDFYDPKHKEIFTAIKDLYREGTPVDAITVSEELKKRKSLETVGGRVYIASLSAEVPSTANAEEYARIIAEKSSLRRLIDAAGQIVEKGYSPESSAEEVLEFAESRVFEIGQKQQKKDYVHIRDVLDEGLELIDKMSKMEGNLIGLSTGFKELDDMTCGLQDSSLIIVAARPSMGKTAFALNIAQQAAVKRGAKVLIFSLEMKPVELSQRMMSAESKVDLTVIRSGKFERRDWDQYNVALDDLSKTEIAIDDTAKTISEIRNKCRRMKASKGLDLVVIDYLQMMNFEGRSESRQQEITTMSRYLKQLANDMECPVIVLSQLSRAPENRNDHRPMLSDLRESGSIEQDADLVMFLYRDEYYNPDDIESAGKSEIIVAKNRNGRTGTVNLTWLGKYTKFANMSME